jgi:HlyD family secretion protein
MKRPFIAGLVFGMLGAAQSGLSYAYYRQDMTYIELWDQVAQDARRNLVALRDAARDWQLSHRDPVAVRDEMTRVYAKVHRLFADERYTYITAPVERGRIATVVRATGTVKPTYTVDISSQLSGRIAEVFVNFNDVVKAGQTLGRLDPEIFAAKVSEARAALKIAQAGLQMQQAALGRFRSALTTAQLARNVTEANRIGLKAKFDESQRELERRLALVRADSVSKADVTRMQAQRDAEAAQALAMTEEAKIRQEAIVMAEADIDMAEANLENSRAIVEQKQAALEQAEVDLARTELRAPIGGVIIKRDVNPGQTVAVSLEAKTLFQIANDLREMEVHGKIDEADIGWVEPGQKATFLVDAYPGLSFTGQVQQVRIAPEVVQNVVTYTVVITAPNPRRLLLPGMTASLRILIDETSDTLKVPNQALRFRPKGAKIGAGGSAISGPPTVWVLSDDGQAVPVQVAIGRSDDKTTELQSGALKENQPVIVGIATSNAGSGPSGIRMGF